MTSILPGLPSAWYRRASSFVIFAIDVFISCFLTVLFETTAKVTNYYEFAWFCLQIVACVFLNK